MAKKTIVTNTTETVRVGDNTYSNSFTKERVAFSPLRVVLAFLLCLMILFSIFKLATGADSNLSFGYVLDLLRSYSEVQEQVLPTITDFIVEIQGDWGILDGFRTVLNLFVNLFNTIIFLFKNVTELFKFVLYFFSGLLLA